MTFMNVSYHRYSEFTANPRKNIQGLDIAYAGKRIETRSVCLAIRSFENQRNVELAADPDKDPGNVESHLFAFDNAWPGNQKEILFRGYLVEVYTHCF